MREVEIIKAVQNIKQTPCNCPNHDPPMFISLQQGKTYTHVCPKCKQKTTITNNIYYCSKGVN
jgi:hypothetical protein